MKWMRYICKKEIKKGHSKIIPFHLLPRSLTQNPFKTFQTNCQHQLVGSLELE